MRQGQTSFFSFCFPFIHTEYIKKIDVIRTTIHPNSLTQSESTWHEEKYRKQVSNIYLYVSVVNTKPTKKSWSIRTGFVKVSLLNHLYLLLRKKHFITSTQDVKWSHICLLKKYRVVKEVFVLFRSRYTSKRNPVKTEDKGCGLDALL